MATTTHVPVEVYLRSSYEPDAEYVDGEIEERPMGEREHVLWQKAILKWFWQHEKEWGVEVLQEHCEYRLHPPATVFLTSRCSIVVSPVNRSSPVRRSLFLRCCLLRTASSV